MPSVPQRSSNAGSPHSNAGSPHSYTLLLLPVFSIQDPDMPVAWGLSPALPLSPCSRLQSLSLHFLSINLFTPSMAPTPAELSVTASEHFLSCGLLLDSRTGGALLRCKPLHWPTIDLRIRSPIPCLQPEPCGVPAPQTSLLILLLNLRTLPAAHFLPTHTSPNSLPTPTHPAGI